MSKKTVIGSFVDQFAALITGDTAKVSAEKAWRQARSALQTKIAELEGNTIALEDEVTTAERGSSVQQAKQWCFYY